jgi:hypothetical protein
MVELTSMAAGQQRVSGAELLHRAQKLRPGLLERQAEAERLRRLPEVTMTIVTCIASVAPRILAPSRWL